MLTVKLIASTVWMTFIFLLLNLLTIGYKKNNSKRMRDCRIAFATFIFKIAGIGLMFFMADVCWISHKRPKVCYKKYLGDSWIPEYRKAST
jgi:hypothetical protein